MGIVVDCMVLGFNGVGYVSKAMGSVIVNRMVPGVTGVGCVCGGGVAAD